MSTRDEELDWLAGALSQFAQPGHVVRPLELAEQLHAQGVRVVDFRTERIVKIEDGPTLAETVRAWQESKEDFHGGAAARAQEQRDAAPLKPGVADAAREELILAALNGAGKPLSRVEAITAAAGWHRDYRPPLEDWEPWRAAWRQLLIQRRVQKTNPHDLGQEARWKAVPRER